MEPFSKGYTGSELFFIGYWLVYKNLLIVVLSSMLWSYGIVVLTSMRMDEESGRRKLLTPNDLNELSVGITARAQ